MTTASVKTGRSHLTGRLITDHSSPEEAVSGANDPSAVTGPETSGSRGLQTPDRFGGVSGLGVFAAVGAAVSSEQDAQQFQWPIMLPLVFSFLMYIMVVREPNSHMVVLLSEIPFFSPIIMVLRIAAETPPFWQIGLSIVLLGLTTAGVAYFSARIYRVGILMYGKRPSVVELMRWVKYT